MTPPPTRASMKAFFTTRSAAQNVYYVTTGSSLQAGRRVKKSLADCHCDTTASTQRASPSSTRLVPQQRKRTTVTSDLRIQKKHRQTTTTAMTTYPVFGKRQRSAPSPPLLFDPRSYK
eukprot:scaffold16111_cov172-Amphora_coffeaeformis.AAC.3